MNFKEFEAIESWDMRHAVWEVNSWFYEEYQEPLDSEQLDALLTYNLDDLEAMLFDWQDRIGVPAYIIKALFEARGGVVD